jgi:hypothetical protein
MALTVVRRGRRGKREEVVVPARHIGKVLAALGPETQDPFPFKWKVLGYDLRLSLKGRRELQIWLYRGSKGRVAFAMGPTLNERIYYLGGPLQGVLDAVEKAVAETKKE